jgi:hypothetical protein
MGQMTHAEALRHRQRIERIRRERMRARRQRAALVAVLLLALAGGTAWALRPPPPPLVEVRHGEGGDFSFDAGTKLRAALVTEKKREIAEAARPKPLVPAPGLQTIVVDRSDQTVTLYEATGSVVDRFPCASGVLYPRVGTYQVYGHDPQSWSLYDNTTFYWFTKFVKSDKGNNIGFHSIPQNPDGTLVGGLGVPVSHGCVRVDKAKAKMLYDWSSVDTQVIVQQ